MWSVSFKKTKSDPWVDTGIQTSSSQEAWTVWAIWRQAHDITDYYTVQVVNGDA